MFLIIIIMVVNKIKLTHSTLNNKIMKETCSQSIKPSKSLASGGDVLLIETEKLQINKGRKRLYLVR